MTPTTEELRERLELCRTHYNTENGKRTMIETALNDAKAYAITANADRNVNLQVSTLLQDLATKARDVAKGFIEELVTNCLKYISNADYRFEIKFSTNKANKAEAEFFIVETVNGIESFQDPEDACGGGFVDIIATALRYAYIEVLNDPVLQGPLLLDEPGKMISEAMSVRYGAFLQELTKSFGRQTIMVTHNASLMTVADHSLLVVKNDSSKVLSGAVAESYLKEDLDVNIEVSELEVYDFELQD